MPIVRSYPIGEVSPQPLPNVQLDVPAAGDINLFGGNRARDLQAAGQQLGQASDSLFAIYQRHAQEANDSRVQDFTNRFMDGSRAILKTGPEAYYKLTGADAIKGADATTAKLKALRDETFGQTANPYQRQRLGPILDAHLAAATAGIVRHTALQQDVYSRRVASDAIATSRAEAKADPSVMPNAVLRAEGAARVVHAGQPPEAVAAGVRATGGSVIADVIGDRLAHNDPIGVTLLQQYGDRLDPSVRRTLSAAADTLSNTLAAATWVRERSASLRTPAPTGDAALDAVNAASPPVAGSPLYTEDGIAGSRQRLDEIDARRHALTALNQQEFAANPARLRANRMAIDTDAARSRAAVKAESDALYADLRRHLTTGGPEGGPAVAPPPVTIMSRLTDAQQDAVSAQIDANIGGRTPGTDPQTWDAIHQGLTADDAGERQRWASTNLGPFMGRLSTEDYAALETLQALVRGNDNGAEQRRLQRVTRMANDALQSVGIDPTPRPDAPPDSDAAQAARFHRAVQDEMSAFESRGRKPTEAEAYNIVNGLKDTGIKSGWLRGRDASPIVLSDFSPDEAFHEDGAQIAQAGPAAQPEQKQQMWLTLDFDRMRREREEQERREADEQAAGGIGGAPGAPATDPDTASPDYQAADAEARRIAAEQAAEETRGRGSAPQTEPAPGSPEYQAAEEEARKLDQAAWENLGVFGQLGIAFKRLDLESRERGATLGTDSDARRLEKVLELQQKAKETPGKLDLAEKRYLLRNRNAASDLASSVARLVDTRRRLEELPSSDPLRQLFEAPSVEEAARLLREHPGEIARAIGVESVPALTISLIATAALGPIAGAVTIGTSGLDGYTKGLIGAMSRAGIDVSNADALVQAFQDKVLMERVRKDATSDAAIEGGMAALLSMVGAGPIARSAKTASKGRAGRVTVYRVEGLPNARFTINEQGHVMLKPGSSVIWLNFGQEGRAISYFNRKMADRLPGVRLKSFEVDSKFLDKIRSAAVPERLAKKKYPRAPIISSDPFPDQFGLRPDQFQELMDSILQGTGKHVISP